MCFSSEAGGSFTYCCSVFFGGVMFQQDNHASSTPMKAIKLKSQAPQCPIDTPMGKHGSPQQSHTVPNASGNASMELPFGAKKHFKRGDSWGQTQGECHPSDGLLSCLAKLPNSFCSTARQIIFVQVFFVFCCCCFALF